MPVALLQVGKRLSFLVPLSRTGVTLTPPWQVQGFGPGRGQAGANRAGISLSLTRILDQVSLEKGSRDPLHRDPWCEQV